MPTSSASFGTGHRQPVSRLFSQFQRDKLITVKRRDVQLVNVAGLAETCPASGDAARNPRRHPAWQLSLIARLLLPKERAQRFPDVVVCQERLLALVYLPLLACYANMAPPFVK